MIRDTYLQHILVVLYGKSISKLIIYSFYSLYHKDYSSPLTVWYQRAKSPITQIKWCQLYFDDEEGAKASSPVKKSKKADEADANALVGKNTGVTHFSARLCEFFAID